MSEGIGKELPEGWKSCSLSEIIDSGVEQNGPLEADSFTYVDIGSVDNETKRVISPKHLAISTAPSRARQNLKSGDVIVSMTRPNLNAIAIIGADLDGAIGSTGFHVLRSLSGEPRWLFYATQTRAFVDAMCSLVQGALYPAVRPRDINAWRFPVPPLAEQTRIADKLDELLSDLDAGVAALERVRSKIKPYRAAVLKAAVEGCLTADWRSRNPDTESATDLLARILAERRKRWEEAQIRKFQEQGKNPPKDWKAKYQEPAGLDATKLPELPQGWCWSTLDQVSYFITSGSRGWAEYYAESGPIFVRSQDIKTDRLILADVAHVNPPESSEGARTRLNRGDLLITITGANVAKAALVDYEIGAAYVSQHVGMTRFVDVTIGPFIHVYATASSGGRKLLLKVAYGAGKPGLNLDNLRELPIPLPPLAEQAAIVEAVAAQLSVIDHLEADLEAKLRSAQALRQSILRDAFEGKLVPQDPNDEPASELLQRIAAAREERAATAKAAKALKKPAIGSPGRGRRRQSNASS